MDHDRGQSDSAEVGQGVLVVAGSDSTPLFEPAEAAFDGVAVAVERGSKLGGRPPSEPLALRREIWSDFSGMVCLIFIARSRWRVELWV